MRLILSIGMPGLVCLAGLMLMAGQAGADSASITSDDCLGAPFTGTATPVQTEIRNVVAGLRPALDGFPTLVSALDAGETRICLATGLVTEQAFYDVEADRIVLSADMPHDLRRVVLVHELRHVEQIARGICPSQSLAMKEYARGVLALEADANVITALVAWKQKSGGDDALWQAFEGWSMTADIAGRFAAVMTERGDVAEAASAAFDQWYVSEERIERYYIASCSSYLDRQDQTHALSGYLPLDDDYLARLCLLPDGRSYDCASALD